MEGKIAIVTGAASGIGRATAQGLINRGATVIVADIDEIHGKAVSAELGPKAHYFSLNVAEEGSWVEAVNYAVQDLGGLHIVVNNAATYNSATVDQADYSEWLRVFRVDAGGPFLGCKHGLKAMKQSGGAIVNVSSNSSVSGIPDMPIYASAKGAVNALTLAVAAQCRTENLPVRCNTVIPGGTKSRMTRNHILEQTGIDIDSGTPEAIEMLAQIGMADPSTVANAIVFLASEEASRINGAQLIVDGFESGIFPISPQGTAAKMATS